ncbi:MAG: N-acetylneuraminate synthase family protein [Acetatifactor sp.]
MSSIKLRDGKIISNFSVPYVIAEVNSSHNGNPQLAREMIDAAAEAGCDCVKFQSWSAKSLYSKTYYKHNPIAKRFVEKFSMSSETLKEMAMYCKEKGIAFSSTPYSKEEVDFLAEECDAAFIKISSMEVNNSEYLEYIAGKGMPIVLSTGMAEFSEVLKAVRILEGSGNDNIAILHCISVYPTPIDKVNLNNMLGLRKMFPDHPVGFSDHTIGDEAAVAATVLGAAVIEKHITLDSTKIGMDNQMAMEPEPLKNLVHKCKTIHLAMGTEERHLCPEEIKQRDNMRRSIVATRDIRAGEQLTKEDLTVKRPGTGLAPTELARVIGCTVRRDIESDTIVTMSDLEI